MRYIPAVDLWSKGLQEAITRGNLRLQPGQWVYCGNPDHLSRFVACTDGYFDVVHWNGSGQATTKRFMQRIECKRMEKLYKSDRAAWKVQHAEMVANWRLAA